jgi:hypothetical protein
MYKSISANPDSLTVSDTNGTVFSASPTELAWYAYDSSMPGVSRWKAVSVLSTQFLVEIGDPALGQNTYRSMWLSPNGLVIQGYYPAATATGPILTATKDELKWTAENGVAGYNDYFIMNTNGLDVLAAGPSSLIGEYILTARYSEFTAGRIDGSGPPILAVTTNGMTLLKDATTTNFYVDANGANSPNGYSVGETNGWSGWITNSHPDGGINYTGYQNGLVWTNWTEGP